MLPFLLPLSRHALGSIVAAESLAQLLLLPAFPGRARTVLAMERTAQAALPLLQLPLPLAFAFPGRVRIVLLAMGRTAQELPLPPPELPLAVPPV